MSDVTKGFVIIILCKRGLTRDIARHLVQVHLQHYWPPADIPLIRRDPKGGLLFGNDIVITSIIYDAHSNTSLYTIYWGVDSMCSLCGRQSTLSVYVKYHTRTRVAMCCECRNAGELVERNSFAFLKW
jgi:hypothetical protein